MPKLLSVGEQTFSPSESASVYESPQYTFTEYLICFSVSNVESRQSPRDVATEVQLTCGAGTNLPRSHRFVRVQRRFLIDKNGSVPWNLADLKSGGDAFSPGEYLHLFQTCN